MIDVIYTVWQSDNSTCSLAPECAPLVERAMKLWTEQKRDTWLEVQGPGDDPVELHLLASTITTTQLSTAEQRLASTLRDKMLDDERAENRRNAGFIESE